MAFFVGNLVISVSGCSLDEDTVHVVGGTVSRVDHRQQAPQHEATGVSSRSRNGAPSSKGRVVNGHTTKIDTGDRKSHSPVETTETCMTFHGVTDNDVLTVTVLDRGVTSSKNCREELMLEAKSLPCTHWGVGFGGRPVLRTCTLTIPESKAVMGAEGSAPIGAGEVSTVELSIRWAPEIRLRSALSLVAVAGGWTRRLLSCKMDKSMAEALNLTLDLAEKVAVIFESSRWKRAALVALVVSFSLGSAWLLAVSVIFFPVTLVIVAMLLLLAPPLAAVLWVLACTTPACEKIWRPLLVWTGVRGGFVRRFLLMPVEDLMDASEDKGFMREEAISRVDPGDEGQGLASELQDNHGAVVGDVIRDGEDEIADVGAMLLLVATCQNMIGVLSSGLKASRWRPRPRKQGRR